MILETVSVGAGVIATGYYVASREAMKKRDEEIDVERKRVRAEEAMENRNRQPKKELFQHFTHKHPLAEVDSESVRCGSCGVCNQPVACGWAYHCSSCNYYQHEVCAKNLVSLSPCSYSRAQEIQSPVDQTVFLSFAHEKHCIKDVYANKEYKCNHCYTKGYGKRFRCDDCKVNLHPVCATCPTKISSFMHPHHDLELKTRRHLSVCAICNKKAGSNIRMYRCKTCKFFVHPACSQLPQHLMHDLHPPHPLQLRPAKHSRRCDANCKSKCERDQWCYECNTCNVSIHISCVLRRSIQGTSDKKEIEEIIQLLTRINDIINNS